LDTAKEDRVKRSRAHTDLPSEELPEKGVMKA